MASRVLLALIALVAVCITAAAQDLTQTITVNGRTFTLPADTPVLIDESPGVLADLLNFPPGLQLRWLPVPDRTIAGIGVPAMVFSYTLIGPVTSTEPLAVLGQPMTLTADTVLEGFADASELAVGDPLVVGGLVDANGSLHATLAERRDAQGNRFLLTGYIQETLVSPERVRVGDQWLDAIGVTFEDCPAATPSLGDYLEVRADAIANFQPGDLIDTVTSATCTTPVPFGTLGAQGLLQGIVSAVNENDSFSIGPLAVQWTAATVFEFGGPDDLEPGADISIEGSFTAADSLLADAVEFVRPVLRVEGPMTPDDVTPGESLRPLGVTVLHSARVRDEDGILGNGLTGPRQVQVRAWLDRDGIAFATRVRDRGGIDPDDVALRGPIESIDPPRFIIQGLTVDGAGAAFFDADGQPITLDTFFTDVRINHIVDVGAAVWNPDTRTLSGGDITLLGYEHTQPLPGELGTIVAGTVQSYGIGDRIFANGFE